MANIKNTVSISNEMNKTVKKKYKCPFCEMRLERTKLPNHIQNVHEDLIPEGFTALRLAFNAINHKTEGHCIICKNVTRWNEEKGRYERLCDNPSCKEAYKKMCAERNKKIYGAERLQTDPRYADDVQRKALEGRRISGKYTFKDGGVHTYVGTYEKKFLEFMDMIMECKSEDLLSPGPTQKYMFNGEEHMYLPDFYYIPYNLIIEIKDGGSNPNNHPHRLGEEQDKLEAKENAIKARGEFNYVRVVNNDFSQLLSTMSLIKYNMINNYHEPIFNVNESTIIESADMSKVVSGFKSKSVPKDIEFVDFKEVKSKIKSKYSYLANRKMFKSTKLNDKDGCLAINHKKKSLVGSIFVKHDSNGNNVVGMFGVNEEYRGYGIGRKLFEIAISDYNADTLGCYVDNEIAFRLYSSCGFKVVETKKDGNGDEYYIMKYSKMNEDMSGTIAAALPNANYSLPIISANGMNHMFTDEDEEKMINEWIEAPINIDPYPSPYEADAKNYYVIQHTKPDGKFSYSITKDPVQNVMLSVDPEDDGFYKVYTTNKSNISNKYLTFKIKDHEAARELYNELALISKSTKRIMEAVNNHKDYIYYRLTESDITSDDQLLFDSRFELVRSPKDQLIKECKQIYDYLTADTIDILTEDIEQFEQDELYNVLPNNINDIEDLLRWKNKFVNMPYDHRRRSDDFSIEKYGKSNLDRFYDKYIDYYNTNDGSVPFKVDQKHVSSEITAEEIFGEAASDVDIINAGSWPVLYQKVKEAEFLGLIIIVPDVSEYNNIYTEDNIAELKKKYEAFQSLPEDKRRLSNQTASNIFGFDNHALYAKILNHFVSTLKVETELDSEEKARPSDDNYDEIIPTSSTPVEFNPDDTMNSTVSESGNIVDVFKLAENILKNK